MNRARFESENQLSLPFPSTGESDTEASAPEDESNATVYQFVHYKLRKDIETETKLLESIKNRARHFFED